jgi:hypothetical protein
VLGIRRAEFRTTAVHWLPSATLSAPTFTTFAPAQIVISFRLDIYLGVTLEIILRDSLADISPFCLAFPPLTLDVPLARRAYHITHSGNMRFYPIANDRLLVFF